MLFFCIILVNLQAQEICDNGIDDNGNGLIDLNDPACICTGFPAFSDETNKIPNPDFEQMVCCPVFVDEVTCAAPWMNGNSATVDYLHTCGYVQHEVMVSPLFPFPTGQGVLASLVRDGWKEYPAVCLNSVFEAGKEYILRFDIGAVKIGPTCYTPIHQFPPINITLFGNAACNMVTGTTECPQIFGAPWEILGAFLYSPNDEWSEIDIVFTPLVDIQGIMIGPSCNIPSFYTPPCWGYFVYDNFRLLEENEDVPAELLVDATGESCANDYFISASVNHSGGFWQWYFNGIAISGANEFKFYLANNQFQSGLYTARYSTPEGCVTEDIYIDIPPRDTTVNEHIFCHGESVHCADSSFNTPGIHEVILTNYLGCDSVVQCVLTQHPISPTTFLQIDTCGVVEIEICNAYYSTSGYYTRNCPDQNGCDSTVILDLRTLNPIAFIEDPEFLPCSPSAEIILNGSYSPLNPFNPDNTFYAWSGPWDGFNGPTDEPMANIIRPGEYCLEVTFEHNGFSCSHSDCVIVEVDGSIPETPTLTGPGSSCPDTVLVFSLTKEGSIPVSGYSWIVPDTLLSSYPNDSTLHYTLLDQDSVFICGYTTNDCGRSDTICSWVFSKPVSKTSFDSFVCDTSLSGVFIDSLVNQHGCDSIIIHNISFAQSDPATISTSTCDSSLVRTDTLVFQNQFGCDSIIFHVVSFAQSDTILFSASTCDPSLVGADTLIFQNQFGCDSFNIKNTLLLRSDTVNLTAFSCDSLLSGVDTILLINEFGCDSMVVLETKYVSLFMSDTTLIICGAGTPYSDTVLISSGPCDSIFITNFEYRAAETSFVFSNTCVPGQDGIYIDTIIDILGCDSLIVINEVSLFVSDTLVSDRVTCNPFDVTIDTFYHLNQYGCDSLVIIRPVHAGIDTVFQEIFSCDSSQIGVVFFVLPGFPCDTPVVQTTHYTTAIEEALTIISCDSTGPLTDTTFLTTMGGCDSILIRHFSYSNLTGQVLIDPELCLGYHDGKLLFIHVSGGALPLLFSINSGIWQSNPEFSNLSPGAYSLLVQDSNGCMWNYPGLIISSGHVFTIDAGPDRDVKLGETITLNATSSQLIHQLTWTALDPVACNTCPNTLLGPISASQTVVLSAISNNGCPASDEVVYSLRAALVPEVFIPNSFSPNRDGINDFFTIFGNDQVVIVRNLSIYDRWGESLYSQDNLPINNPNVGWDGSFRNAMMMPGVFVYVAEIEFVDGSIQLYKGEVTLLR
jgi:gliding motility-associated-like protein